MTESGWTIDFVNELARAELRAMPDDMRRAVDRLLRTVEAVGVEALRAPHAKHLGDGLWELRFGGRTGIARTLYVTAPPKRVVVLHSFIKKTQSTPERALRLARQRMKLVS